MQLAERWIIATLRNRKFFSIEALNQAIRELRDRVDQRRFRKREGSRATQFAAVDKPAMGSLPAERSDLSAWSRARVNIDYHIAFDTNYYSVPYNLVQELVEVRSTPTTIEIFHKSQRVASHLRARGHAYAVTIAEHRPRSHPGHLEWTPSRMVHWAKTIGPHTARLASWLSTAIVLRHSQTQTASLSRIRPRSSGAISRLTKIERERRQRCH